MCAVQAQDYAGAKWALPDFFAVDKEDAIAKLRAIGATGRVVFGPVVKSYSVGVWMPQLRMIILLLACGALFGALLVRLSQ